MAAAGRKNTITGVDWGPKWQPAERAPIDMARINPSAFERSTAATDLLLAVVAAGGIIVLNTVPSGPSWKLRIWSGAFAMIALAGLSGFVAHGWILSDRRHRGVWHLLNLSLGLAVSLFVVGVVFDLGGRAPAARILPFMLAGAAVFFLATLYFKGVFRIFIIYEALALCFASVAYGWLAATRACPANFLMAGGVWASLLAALVQTRRGLAWKMVWQFDHNGLFHLLQTIGLMMLIAGVRIAEQ
jgi:hypothetical protein